MDPVVQMVRDGHVLCEDCWEYCSLQKRRAAVRSARKRKREEEAKFGKSQRDVPADDRKTFPQERD